MLPTASSFLITIIISGWGGGMHMAGGGGGCTWPGGGGGGCTEGGGGIHVHPVHPPGSETNFSLDPDPKQDPKLLFRIRNTILKAIHIHNTEYLQNILPAITFWICWSTCEAGGLGDWPITSSLTERRSGKSSRSLAVRLAGSAFSLP